MPTDSDRPASCGVWKSNLEEADHPEYPLAFTCFCAVHVRACSVFRDTANDYLLSLIEGPADATRDLIADAVRRALESLGCKSLLDADTGAISSALRVMNASCRSRSPSLARSCCNSCVTGRNSDSASTGTTAHPGGRLVDGIGLSPARRSGGRLHRRTQDTVRAS